MDDSAELDAVRRSVLVDSFRDKLHYCPARKHLLEPQSHRHRSKLSLTVLVDNRFGNLSNEELGPRFRGAVEVCRDAHRAIFDLIGLGNSCGQVLPLRTCILFGRVISEIRFRH